LDLLRNRMKCTIKCSVQCKRRPRFSTLATDNMSPSRIVTVIGLAMLAVLAIAHSKIPGLRRLSSHLPTPRAVLGSGASVGGAAMLGCVGVIIALVCYGMLYNAGILLVRLATWGRVSCAPFRLDVPRSPQFARSRKRLVSMNLCMMLGLLFWIVIFVALAYTMH